MTDEKTDFVEKIKSKINSDGLNISRIPLRQKQWFIDYANDYFCGDYGMTFKHIIDSYRGMVPAGNDELYMQVSTLTEQVNELRSKLENNEQKKVIKMANGREIVR